MSIHLSVPNNKDLEPRIVVLGIGGGGGNAINNMMEGGLEGVEFIAVNTDAQALSSNKAERRIQIGAALTEGLGAGSDPQIGAQAAQETLAEIIDVLQGAHMLFIAVGMGGGTGTGAAPIIAQAAKDLGILTIGVITKPFAFEGEKRMRIAEAGIVDLTEVVDTLVVIPNENLYLEANEETTFRNAFKLADNVLYSGISGITDLMLRPGLINLDFADVRKIMQEMGRAMFGTGEESGENRAENAAGAAISNRLLDMASMKGARGVLINISGGPDLTLHEVTKAAEYVRNQVDGDADIIFGAAIIDNLEGRIRVSVVATGIGDREAIQPIDNDVIPISGKYTQPPEIHETQAQDNLSELPVPAEAMTQQDNSVEQKEEDDMSSFSEVFDKAYESNAEPMPDETLPAVQSDDNSTSMPEFLREERHPVPIRRNRFASVAAFFKNIVDGGEAAQTRDAQTSQAGIFSSPDILDEKKREPLLDLLHENADSHSPNAADGPDGENHIQSGAFPPAQSSGERAPPEDESRRISDEKHATDDVPAPKAQIDQPEQVEETVIVRPRRQDNIMSLPTHDTDHAISPDAQNTTQSQAFSDDDAKLELPLFLRR